MYICNIYTYVCMYACMYVCRLHVCIGGPFTRPIAIMLALLVQ